MECDTWEVPRCAGNAAHNQTLARSKPVTDDMKEDDQQLCYTKAAALAVRAVRCFWRCCSGWGGSGLPLRLRSLECGGPLPTGWRDFLFSHFRLTIRFQGFQAAIHQMCVSSVTSLLSEHRRLYVTN